MIRYPLTYHRPASLAEACQLRSELPDNLVLGGGTWVVSMLGRDELRARHVIDLRGLGLNTVRSLDDDLEIGSMTTYRTLRDSGLASGRAGLLTLASAEVTGGCQIQNLGTLGGSACFARPGSDIPGALVGAGATLALESVRGRREVPAAEFFAGPWQTHLEPDEILTWIKVPHTPARTAYRKVKIATGGWPVATASASVGDDGRATVALGSVQATPLLLDVSDLLGQDKRSFVQGVQSQIVEPWNDNQASAAYRRSVAGVIAYRAISACQERAS